ncbi:hypothetical protein BHM03_00051752, partial [Ensete ventricosum]
MEYTRLLELVSMKKKSSTMFEAAGSPSGYRYADRPLPGGSVKNRPLAVDFGRRRPIEKEIDRRRSIEREIDRRRSIEEEKGKKKRKKKRRGEERIPRLRAVLARLPSPPVGRQRAVAGRGHFSPARGDRSRR